MKNILLFFAASMISASVAAQSALSCKLTIGDNLAHCDISAEICNSSFEVNSTTRTIRQTGGLYASADVRRLVWGDSSVYLEQAMPDTENSSNHLVRSDLNRLTGEMHVRNDWLYKGGARYRVEVWQCEVRKQLF